MPNVSDVRLDVYLTKYILDYLYNPASAFIADTLCPRKKVGGSSYKYKKYAKESLRADELDLKAQKGVPSEIDWSISEESGKIKKRELMHFIADDEVRESPDNVRPFERATLMLTTQLKLSHELRMVTLLEATSNTTAAGNTWGNASGDILANLRSVKSSIFGASGRYPTCIAASAKAWEEAAGSSKIEAQIKYQNALDVVSIDGAKLAGSKPAGLEGVISKALHDSSIKGATESVAHVLGTSAYSVLVDGAPEALTWAIQPYYEDFRVVRWRDEARGGFWVKVTHGIDLKIVCADALWELSDVTT
jgi:hypothetical protein